jgi:hypothetical protein
MPFTRKSGAWSPIRNAFIVSPTRSRNILPE